MKTYKIIMRHSFDVEYEVEATNEQEALKQDGIVTYWPEDAEDVCFVSIEEA